MRLETVVKGCLSTGLVIAVVLLLSFDVGSVQKLYFTESVVEVDYHPYHNPNNTPTENTTYNKDSDSDSTTIIVHNPSPPRKCYKNVPRHGERCGYYANIAESMKSGTTALWNLMNQHPRIWGRALHCSFANYSECLIKAHASPARANIDKGPVGTRCQELIDKMYEEAPYQKLIFLFRHPVDRLYSHYQHQVRSTVMSYNGTFEKWIRRALSKNCFDPETQSWRNCFYNTELCARGKNPIALSAYADILELYWSRFPRSESYILITEELYSNTQKHMDELMDWLGLDRITYSSPRNSNIQSYEPLDRSYRKLLYEKYFKANVERLEVILGRKLPWTA